MRRAAWWTVTTAFVVAFVVFAPMVVGSSDPRRATSARTSDLSISDLIADSAPADLSCTSGTYGEPTTCTVIGASAAQIAWPDGTVTAVEADGMVTQDLSAVGSLDVVALNRTGLTVARASITIAPDIAVSCEDDDVHPVYELVPSDAWARGWDYVYLDDAGNRLLPGADSYPLDPGLTSLEAVVVGEAPRTGPCAVTSAAKDDFDGHVTWHLVVPFDEPVDVRLSTFTPFNRSHWLGVQPGELTATVHVNDASASERRGVYSSGCT